MKKSFWFWLAFGVAVILATYFSVRIVMTYLGHGPSSIIKTIHVHSDTSKRNLSSVGAAAGIAPGTHTFSASLYDIQARILTIPDIKTVAIRRLPNGNLSIKLDLHQIIASWTDGINFYPLSSHGTVINRPMSEQPDEFILFRGKLPLDITEITQVTSNIINDIEYIEWIENRRWNIITTGGIKILLPEFDSESAISSLLILNKNQNILSKKIEVLDLRDSARILIK